MKYKEECMRRHVFRVVLCIACICFWGTAAFAQEPAAPPAEPEPGASEPGPRFGFSLGLLFGQASFGTNDLGETETYQKLGVFPDFSYGDFGIGLDFYLHYRFVEGDFQVRQEDWIPSGDQTILDIIFSKIRYVRWARKGDPLYIKFGSIDNNILGNGYIMGNYDNTLFLPEKRILGLNFDMDGRLFGFPLIGLETMVDDVAALDLFGARLFVRPLGLTDIPILSMLELGTTFVMDRDPFKYVDGAYVTSLGFDPDKEHSINAIGVDLKQPVLTQAPFTFSLFGDLVWLDDFKATGAMVGLGGKIIDIFTYTAQLRINGENFIPVYFDQTYDLSRADKYALVKNGGIESYLGWYAGLGMEITSILFFQVSLEGPLTEVDAAYIKYPHLRAVLTLQQGLVPGLSVDVLYDKAMLGSRDGFFEDLFTPEDALTTIKIHYTMGPAMITLLYEIRYVPDAGAGEDKWQVTSGLECALTLPL
jgi:hypothetical protein